MSTRLAKTSRTSRPPTVQLHCPGCRTTRTCRVVGSGTVAGKRREIVQCGDKNCELVWVPGRTHLAATPTAA